MSAESSPRPKLPARTGLVPGARWGAVLAVAAGVLLPLGFAPFDWALLGILCPALLFLLWLDAPPRRAAWYGYLFGLGMFGVGASWVHVSIHEFGHTSHVVSIPLTALFVLGLALFPALSGYAAAHAARPGRLRLLVVLPCAWVLVEWVRGWFLTGFPWLNLGYSQIDMPAAGLAPLAGVYGVSLLSALVAALLVALVEFRGVLRWLGVAALVLLLGGGQWLRGAQWTQPVGEPLRATLIQGNISQHVKWAPEMREPTLQMYRELTARHWDSDLVVWPETAVPAFHHQVAEGYLAALGREARAHGTDIVTGIAVADAETRRYHNSLVTIGGATAFYHKRHLVPFGEYVPLEGLLRGLIGFFDLPMSDFSGGPDVQAPLPVAGQRAAASICYEIAFGEEVIRALPEATLLLTVSNDAWFGDSLAPHQHLQIARMRVLETGRPLLRATNTGISAIIDARGEIVARSPQFQRDVLSASIQPRTGATPYVRFGNLPVVLLVVIALGVAVVAGRRSRFQPGSSL